MKAESLIATLLGTAGAILGFGVFAKGRPMSETPLARYLKRSEPLRAPSGGLHYPNTSRIEWAHQRNYGGARDREVDSIVIHTVEGSAQSAVNTFQHPDAERSAHYIVTKAGEVILVVPEHLRAWHAGHREWNQRSIGIEHEGRADDPATWTEPLLATSSDLAGWLAARYGFDVNRSRVASHAEITPGRRSDPGPHFPWGRYLNLAQAAKARYDKRPIPEA